MRVRFPPGLLWVAALLVGCDTTQPALVESQTLTLDFQATGARTADNRTWEMWEDSDVDGAPDDVNDDGTPDVFLWCEPVAGSQVNANSVPWNFSVQVDVLRAGEQVPVTLIRAVDSNPGRAEYDSRVGNQNNNLPANTQPVLVTHPRGECRDKPNISCNPSNVASTICPDNDAGFCLEVGSCSADPSQPCFPNDPGQPSCQQLGLGSCDVADVTRRFVFNNTTNRRLLTTASRTVLEAPDNILFDTSPTTALATKSNAINAVSTGGICPGQFLGPANIEDQELPFSFTLNKGDTVIVEARRLDALPGGNIPIFVQPGISSFLTVDGTVASVNGTTSTAANSESFIQFFYTSQ